MREAMLLGEAAICKRATYNNNTTWKGLSKKIKLHSHTRFKLSYLVLFRGSHVTFKLVSSTGGKKLLFYFPRNK